MEQRPPESRGGPGVRSPARGAGKGPGPQQDVGVPPDRSVNRTGAGREAPGSSNPAIGAGAPRPRLLDRVRGALRLRHYSRRTEEAYVYWARRFILFHGKRHPDEMGAGEVTAFLNHLAIEGRWRRPRRTRR